MLLICNNQKRVDRNGKKKQQQQTTRILPSIHIQSLWWISDTDIVLLFLSVYLLLHYYVITIIQAITLLSAYTILDNLVIGLDFVCSHYLMLV